MITGGYQLPNTIQKAAKNDRELNKVRGIKFA